MYLTQKIKQILRGYESETPAVKSNLVKILMNGRLSGTGKIIILPVDQGFEHGPEKSFSLNKLGYDPEYHIKLALEAGLSAYAAPKGMIEAISDEFRGTIPLILKANNSNSLVSKQTQINSSITASIKDAIYLGCTGIGFTIYPGSNNSLTTIQEVSEMIAEAKSHGLVTVLWSYPRGGDLSKEGETALDTVAYAAHIAVQIGANIVKVKLPSSIIENQSLKNLYSDRINTYKSLKNRIQHIMEVAFMSKRLVLFSGGSIKRDEEVYQEASNINAGGGHGSMIGRNSFQRPYKESIKLLSNIIEIYLNNT